jgi:hypothetical protein
LVRLEGLPDTGAILLCRYLVNALIGYGKQHGMLAMGAKKNAPWRLPGSRRIPWTENGSHPIVHYNRTCAWLVLQNPNVQSSAAAEFIDVGMDDKSCLKGVKSE